MASTFFGLDIAYTGVQAANAKLNTTANNIANVDTKGYTRQEATQVASDALRISQSYGMAGTGVTVTDPAFDYDALSQSLLRSEQITQALDHLVNKVNMDCHSCALQEICEEVEKML